MNIDVATVAECLRSGNTPRDKDILTDLTVGLDYLTDFWEENYLASYIPLGGSKIQFITGRMGSGKTHLIEYFTSRPRNYKTVSFSAREVWINDFKEIFFEVLRQCDLGDCLLRCGEKLVGELGYQADEFTGDFMEYLSEAGDNNPITRREIRRQLDQMFMHNPLMDNNFAYACALLTGGALGHPLLEETSREALLGWLSGNKEVKLSTLRSLGLSPTRISKHNARHMLRSLIEVIKMAGYDGLVIAIDDLDILVSGDSLEEIRYTKVKRDDVYESIRELIDEIDTLRSVFMVLAFNRKLIDNDAIGIKSYQALWFRIQNEIKSDRVNRFSSMIDLDTLPIYDAQTAMELSGRISKLLSKDGAYSIKPLTEQTVSELISKTGFSEISLPRRIVMETVNGGDGAAYGF